MVVVAVLVLNLFHPGYCFREGCVQKKYANLFRRKRKPGNRHDGIRGKEHPAGQTDSGDEGAEIPGRCRDQVPSHEGKNRTVHG